MNIVTLAACSVGDFDGSICEENHNKRNNILERYAHSFLTMLAHPRRGLVLDNNNYGILQRETYFGFAPPPMRKDIHNTSEHNWVLAPVKMGRSLQDSPEVGAQPELSKRRSKHRKCIFKILKKGEHGEDKGKKRRRRHGGKTKFGKKIMMPLILGILAAKSVLVPIALKALAFLSTKGLMMGFFSTVMASVLSLKGMFDNNHRYSDRKDDKTQVEVIQIPQPTKEDHYYSEIHEPYRRYDVVPLQPL